MLTFSFLLILFLTTECTEFPGNFNVRAFRGKNTIWDILCLLGMFALLFGMFLPTPLGFGLCVEEFLKLFPCFPEIDFGRFGVGVTK